AYVLILAVAGPVLARGTEPLAARLRKHRAQRRAPQTDDDVPVITRPAHTATGDTGPTPTVS
ncbi:cation:proton antiporter, partial [Micromonospora aurantiaca]|nr:cation:proton antiporter [Micromonospora aurantiaca]